MRRLAPAPATIDLNADVGERPSDLALMGLVTSASIACGAHAGDRASMRAAIAAALGSATVIGAHPSYPDPSGFGRIELGLAPGEIVGPVVNQVMLLESLAADAGARVAYLKLHGALYHRANAELAVAEALLSALATAGASVSTILAAPGSAMLRAGEQAGWHTAAEGFCDRAYRPDGGLVARGHPGALLEEPDRAAAQAVSLATEAGVTATDGTFVPVAVESVCLHGDTPGARALATRVRAALEQAGITVRPFAA